MPSKQIPMNARTHGEIQFFSQVSPILLILRISTGQRFRKEWSVHEPCTGWIMEYLDFLNYIRTDSDPHKNSWRYWGFSFPFHWFWGFWGFQLDSTSGRSGLFIKAVWDELWRASIAWIWSKQIPIRTRIHADIQVFHFHLADFADFEDFNRPAHQEGAVCSRSFYRMNYRADRGLEFRLHRIWFPQELMDIFMFFISMSPILLILRISTTSVSGRSGLFITLVWDEL